MSAHDGGGPAFPIAVAAIPGVQEGGHEFGMSLRDWFAGQALAGMLADPEVIAPAEDVAKVAYNYANAMLAERAKVEKS